MTVELRDYQQASVDAMVNYWANGGGHGLIVLPTGAGKSLVAASLIKKLYEEYEAKILLASHVAKLIAQNAQALARIWPNAPYGIYHAGLGKRDARAPICFAGIHSIHRKPEILGERHVVLIDEVHLLDHKDSGMYRNVIKHYESEVPGMRVGGLTATPYRLSTGMLTEDYGQHKALFDDIVYEVDILTLIKRGYLCPVLPYVSPNRIDVSGVKTSGGDYNKKELQEACDKDDINERVVDEVIHAGEQRRTWLVFASGVEHAKHLAEIFAKRGILAKCITGETPEDEREKAYRDAQTGSLRCLVGINTLTTGVDIPNIDLIAMVRPTKSKGLWTQMLGRGTRLSDGKTDCILLDFTQNSLTHGPLDLLSGKKQKGESKGPPVRECPDCTFVHHISLRHCPQCNHEYSLADIKYAAQARTGALLSTQMEPVHYNVDTIRARRHTNAAGITSLRLDYVCGLLTISHWVSLEHPTSAGYAKKWWVNNSMSGEAPESVDDALERIDDLRIPGRICVTREGKYFRITNWDYSVPPGKHIPVERDITPKQTNANYDWRNF